MTNASVIFKGLPFAATAIFAAMAWAAPAQAEGCPWDMVYDRQAQNCVYYQPGGSAGGSNSNTANGGHGLGVGIGQGGSATGGSSNATGGNATANGGKGGQGGAGGIGHGGSASVGNLSNQQGQQQQMQQGQTAHGGNAAGGSSSNSIRIDNRTRQSAAQASPVIMGGYGPANCFGDTNPSGQFGASMQVFGWGVTANSSKASNVCAAYAIGGPALALGYLQRVDPNMPRRVTVQQPTGRLTCPATHPIYVEGKGCRK